MSESDLQDEFKVEIRITYGDKTSVHTMPRVTDLQFDLRPENDFLASPLGKIAQISRYETRYSLHLSGTVLPDKTDVVTRFDEVAPDC